MAGAGIFISGTQRGLYGLDGRQPADRRGVVYRLADHRRVVVCPGVLGPGELAARLRYLLQQLLVLVPESGRSTASYLRAKELASAVRRNLIHLIYRDKPYESYHKDYQFGLLTMNEHWSTGLADMQATLQHSDWLEKPAEEHPFVTHDVHRGRTD